MTSKIKVHTVPQLTLLVTRLIQDKGEDVDLNHLDVSEIPNFHGLFAGVHHVRGKFCGDISQWDVSNAVSLMHMFKGNETFKGDLSRWDVGRVCNFVGMFEDSVFDGDVSGWNVQSGKVFVMMFRQSLFNQSLENWRFSEDKNIDMSCMFEGALFDRPLDSWNLKSVTNTEKMFKDSVFNQDLSAWSLPSLRDANQMFAYAKFNQGIFEDWGNANLEAQDVFKGSGWAKKLGVQSPSVAQVIGAQRSALYQNILNESLPLQETPTMNKKRL